MNGDPIAVFRAEAQDLFEQIEQGLLDLEHQPDDRSLVDAIFRGLHTLKGSGAMFGFDALAAFTHHCETAFDRVRKGEVAPTPQLIASVLGAQDHMRALAEGSETSAAVGQALLAGLDRAVREAERANDAACLAPPRDAAVWRIDFRLPADALTNGTRPLVLLDELRALGPCEVTVDLTAAPPLEALVPGDCHLGWRVLLTSPCDRSAIEEVFMFVIDDMTLTIEPHQPTDRAPPAAEAVAPAIDAQPAGVANADAVIPVQKATGDTVRVPAERLDELMDRVGELVIAQSRLSQLSAASADSGLRAVAEDIERLAAGMRDTMMLVRMAPVGQMFTRFRRLVHDLARDTGKPIELRTQGEATELDKTVLERLADPLIHILRNAADHGLEAPADRTAAGKPPGGRIMLSARQAGAEVIISVTDDGRGIDRDRVRAKAETQGLIAPGAILDDQELLQLIFHPGFSTAQEVTSLSGRGVGMDVVKRTVESLRGAIEIVSTPGQGCEVSLRLPLTLAIIEGLLVRVGSGRYVIPLASVQECIELTLDQDQRSSGRSLASLRDQLVPFLRLRDLFETGTPAELHQKIVVVASEGARVGLVVDQILGNHQTVIKSMPSLHRQVGAFSGATILGDGGVALILDTVQLVVLGQHREARRAAAC